MEFEQGHKSNSQEFKSVYNEDIELFQTCYGEGIQRKSQSNQPLDWNFEVFEQPGLERKYTIDRGSYDFHQINSEESPVKNVVDSPKSNLYKSQRISKSYNMIGNIHYFLKGAYKKPKNQMQFQLASTINQPLLYEEQKLQIHEEMSFVGDKDNQRRRTIVANIETNRLLKIKGSNQYNEQKKPEWTWDASAALIRLMIRNRKIRIFTNFYIWVLLGLRIFYIVIVLNFFLKNVHQLKSFTYFWIVFIALVSIRLTFMLIVLKIFTQGYKINDQKIKIVYETYMQILDQYRKQINIQKGKKQFEIIKRIRVRMFMRQFWMVITPPEFSFIFVTISEKMQSGYYQVQNFIMKSLEIFFFVPFLIYFLNTNVTNSFSSKLDFLNWYYFTTILLYSDVALFSAFVIYLLFNSQRKPNYKIERGYI